MMTTQLVLIRHGITEWNKKNRYCGYKDVSLSDEGKAQAKRLASGLKSFEFHRIYSSDRKRALQTGRIIFNGAKIIKVEALREINFGCLEGLTHEEIMKKHADVYKKWLKDPFKNRIPGAEPMAVFKKRVQLAIRKIAGINRGKTVAITCHGGVIGILVSGILKSKNFWRYVPSSASMTIVEYKKGAPVIKLFNNHPHLGGARKNG
ncbi:MAG: histidine phosphatase family protein [Candidatus Omnitrophota bacterium]|nr:histidine phosphatase family protein [Candidatus Omnitrophota bacterium]